MGASLGYPEPGLIFKIETRTNFCFELELDLEPGSKFHFSVEPRLEPFFKKTIKKPETEVLHKNKELPNRFFFIDKG
jgi:hypothetical protein